MDKETHVDLTRPFDMRKIKWRVGSTNQKSVRYKTGDTNAKATKGIVLAYIDARDVMQRLDTVIGCQNWQDNQPRPGYCELSIKIGDNWITKSDCAGETSVEAEKGQSSDAFKRAAVKWGIGRYLYYLDNVWVDLDNGYLPKNFQAPQLPEFADPIAWTKYYPRMMGQPTD